MALLLLLNEVCFCLQLLLTVHSTALQIWPGKIPFSASPLTHRQILLELCWSAHRPASAPSCSRPQITVVTGSVLCFHSSTNQLSIHALAWPCPRPASPRPFQPHTLQEVQGASLPLHRMRREFLPPLLVFYHLPPGLCSDHLPSSILAWTDPMPHLLQEPDCLNFPCV